MQKRIQQALVLHLFLSLVSTGLYAEDRKPMISTVPSLTARLYSSFTTANSFFYYLFYPFVPTFTPTVVAQHNNETVKVIDVQNFMFGGTYPSTPSNPMWFTTTNGNVPTNAAVYKMENGMTTYHCRAYYQDDYQDGELIPGQGCYVKQGQTLLRFTMYDVLLNPYSQ